MMRRIRRALVAAAIVGSGAAAGAAPPAPPAAPVAPRTAPAPPVTGSTPATAAAATAAPVAPAPAPAPAPASAPSGPLPTLADVIRHQQRAAVAHCRAATLEKRLHSEIGGETTAADYLAAHAEARDARSRRIKRLIAEVEAISSDNVRLYHEQVTMRGALAPAERQQVRDLERRLVERCRA